MDAAAMRALVDQYLAGYNAMDLDAMLAPLHPEIEFRNLSGSEVNASASGIAALRALAQQSLQLFARRRQRLTAFQVEGERASANIDFEAVLAADLPSGLRAGETMRLTGRSEFAFRDGRIVRIDDFS